MLRRLKLIKAGFIELNSLAGTSRVSTDGHCHGELAISVVRTMNG